MIIILKKDGQIVTDDGNPVEGVKLENAAAILADPKDGDTIVYDATAGMWVAGSGGGSFEPDITNPQDGDTLVYDGTEEKWVNGSGGGGSGGGYLKLTENAETGALDKTWKEIYDAFSAGYYVSLIIYGEDVGVTYHMNRPVTTVAIDNGSYIVVMFNPTNAMNNLSFITDSENGYPVEQSGGGLDPGGTS